MSKIEHDWRALLLCFLLAPFGLKAQNFTGGFSFYMPPDDTTTAAFLPKFPAQPLTANDGISSSGGHFIRRGQPIRFFGTNLVADGAFPTKSEAPYVAGRLRQMGFNLVRFHHIDNRWGAGSLFEWGRDTRHLDPATLDRLDYLLAHLKRNGIYANINLHVSRQFDALDGVPDADSLWSFGKGVTLFDPQLIALQKEYAQQLLTHVNPYTGLRLADDPVVAMVEITNENSLYFMWQNGMLRPYSHGGVLTVRHTAMLDSLWHAYLRTKYASTADLAAAWNTGLQTGTNQIIAGDFETIPIPRQWVLEVHAPANAQFAPDANNPYRGSLAAHVIVTATDGVGWHVQWKHTRLTLQKDSVYTVLFAARADAPHPIAVVLQKDTAPWTYYGGESFTIGTSWQEYTFSFIAPETSILDARLSFAVAEQTGQYWFDEVRLVRGVIAGLEEGEQLETGNVRRIAFGEAASFSDARVRDITSFYIALQDSYFAEMHAFLRNTVGVRVPIESTNWNFGLPDLAVQAKLDYMDNHAYWDHPQFPNQPWSPTDWRIDNQPMVRDAAGGTIARLFSGMRYAGKPFTVSEYNHAFPNRFQTEGVLFLAAYAAFHGLDAIMFFDYNSSKTWREDKIDGYFSIHRNPAMMALMPSCAYAFRHGLISPAKQVLQAAYHPDDVLLAPKRGNIYVAPPRFPRTLALQHSIVTQTFESPTRADFSGFPPEPASPYIADTGELIWDTAGLLQVVTPQFVAATGFFDEFPGRQMGPLQLRAASDFGTLTWISLTGESLLSAERTLITISSRAQNTRMVWDGTHTVHNNWGHAPTLVYPLRLDLQFTIHADSLRVVPLNAEGNPTGDSMLYPPVGPNTFSVALDQMAQPTLWFGVEAIGEGSPITGIASGSPHRFALAQNFPNPFNAGTRIRFSLPQAARVRLLLHDLNGRLVSSKAFPGQAGENNYGLQLPRLASGVYVYTLIAPGFRASRKMLLLR